ncbi:related to UTP13-U3 snoRNP protein [Sporisorium reilianum f. sp. reilianum]|uniref:Related to UTP13-U3 snoRNP protein n=1 Tax=Sporisorium reilianum f. sp. reilianum TaxID=72559 RepID=A0A2N8UAX5_9BASI|nr:related to UTP13-U3 snoRNP protein [Sporisorium reilianum f. sp. reilianum]
MADAQVLTPDQIQQILAAQQQQASTSSSSPPQSHRLKTSFAKTRTFEPFYTGGATALTPDGALLFATLNEQVAVVDVATGSVVQRLEGDTEEVTALAVTPTGTHLVVASRSLALSVYALPACRLVRTIAKSHASQVNLMSVDPTGTLLATGGADGVAKVWDVEGGFCTHAFKGHAGVVSALAWNMPSATAVSGGKKKSAAKSARTMQLLTGSVDGKVRVWDLNTPAGLHKPVATLAGHDSVVRGIGVTPDGATLVTGSRDRTLVVWRLPPSKSSATAAWKQAETLSANEGIESVGFLPPSSLAHPTFWTGGSDGTLRLWDLATAAIVAREPRSFNEHAALQSLQDDEDTRAITAVHYVASSPAPCLVSVHADQNIVFRAVAAEQPLKKVRQLVGFNDEIVDLALLAAAGGEVETHLAVATNSRALRVYAMGEGDETSVELLPGHADIVLCVDRSPDMRLLASGAKDRTARIWAWVPASRLAVAVEKGEDDAGRKVSRGDAAASSKDDGEWVCMGICEGHTESVGAIAFARRPSSPGAPYAPFIVTASQDRTVKVWDLTPLNTLLSSTDPITAPLHLKSLTTQRVHEKDINCVDVSPNNAMLATGSQDRTAKLLSLTFTAPTTTPASARLTTLATLKGHKRGIWALRFSPTDLALATASGDKTVRLWSLKTYASVKLFQGHTNSVLKLAFVSAGMQLLSCAGDGLVKVWNVRDEECAATLDAHDDKVWSVAVARGEAWFVSAAADGTLGVWRDRTEEEREEKRVEREDEVRMEQEFGNMLTRKDWKNAISLALHMAQPRRLLALFTHVSSSRPEGRAKDAGLLASVFAADSDDEEAEMQLVGDDDDAALAAVGIPRRRPAARKPAHPATADDADATSITGLAAVDSIIATLPAPLLIQLLLYIRDWNTSTRTSPIAQTLLHAILSTHTAAHLIAIFSTSLKTHRAALAERAENEELGIVAALGDKQRARERRMDRERNVDLGTLVEGLLPYTERHWQRADRTLIEASMLEYSVEAMDTLLGVDEEDEGATFGDQLGGEVEEEDVDMSDAESS